MGEVMGMTPCLLCWYQRLFMFPLAFILGQAAFAEDRRGGGLRPAFGGGWRARVGLPHRTGGQLGTSVVGATAGGAVVQ